MKQLFKAWITKRLVRAVVRLRKRHSFTVIAVAGSAGKTSTKFAIGQLLSQRYRVRYQEGNYNIPMTVALVFFGLPIPSLHNPFAWLVTLLQIELQIRRPYPYDVVIVELGTDGPGQLAEFSGWLRPDIGVLTAVLAEHMEYFGTIHEVAKEEMILSDLCSKLIINRDLVDARFMPQRQDMYTYGLHEGAYYQVQDIDKRLNANFVYDCSFAVAKQGQSFVRLNATILSDVQLYSIAAATAVADALAVSPEDIQQGAARLTTVQGRMIMFAGLHGSRIIDDTYNASPDAMKAALRALYDLPGTQKIAVLGSMNELGSMSASAHAEVGSQCDASQLAVVVTLGADANTYLAPAAEKQGCKVVRSQNHNEATAAVLADLREGGLVLVKGSQNGVFAEEVVKQLLADPADASRLVRQSPTWIKRKQIQGEQS